MLVRRPLILFIDAYDSFSNNIISLLETTLHVSVRIVKIDDQRLATDAALHEELRHYVAVVCGPGPGDPSNKEDVGIIQRIWRLSNDHVLPVLGICLGFQSLCLEFGAEVKRLKGPQHGIIRSIVHAGVQNGAQWTIFSGVGELQATLYQSLCADTRHDITSKEFTTAKWRSSSSCPDLIPLAWAEYDSTTANDSGVMDKSVLVAVQHCTRPFWGLQYHPESICSNSEGFKVILNWYRCALQWVRFRFEHKTIVEIVPTIPILGQSAKRPSLLSMFEQPIGSKSLNWMRGLKGDLDDAQFRHEFLHRIKTEIRLTRNAGRKICHCMTIDMPDNLAVQDIYEAVRGNSQDQILLESSNANQKCAGTADVRGTHSIIAMNLDSSNRIEHITGQDFATLLRAKYSPNSEYQSKLRIPLQSSRGIWPFLAHVMETHRVEVGEAGSPFWGGFMGYMTYEMGLKEINVTSNKARHSEHIRPDLSFVWVNRSLVINHREKMVYIQALAGEFERPEVQLWMNSVAQMIMDASLSKINSVACETEHQAHLTYFRKSVKDIKSPSNEEYESKVQRCQSYIRSGDSYELCLTDRTSISRYKYRCSPHTIQSSVESTIEPPSNSSWLLYQTLRTRQPAPFASYLCLGSTTLISSSPERFLTYTASGHCELRPMKGTVKKSLACSTLAQATALLNVPKEKAENLMIVDLVRHDLHGVCGAGNVQVPRLMVVEEYASVYQMISVVQGKIPDVVQMGMKGVLSQDEVEKAQSVRYTGIDALAASLPPGSMTGAPKKRSCEILQEIEARVERGLYSGVVGYLDVGGRGDWSVTIRSLFKWDDEDAVDESGRETETWHIGAGGAVTALSSLKGEREEMQAKLAGTLGIFT